MRSRMLPGPFNTNWNHYQANEFSDLNKSFNSGEESAHLDTKSNCQSNKYFCADSSCTNSTSIKSLFASKPRYPNNQHLEESLPIPNSPCILDISNTWQTSSISIVAPVSSQSTDILHHSFKNGRVSVIFGSFMKWKIKRSATNSPIHTGNDQSKGESVSDSTKSSKLNIIRHLKDLNKWIRTEFKPFNLHHDNCKNPCSNSSTSYKSWSISRRFSTSFSSPDFFKSDRVKSSPINSLIYQTVVPVSSGCVSSNCLLETVSDHQHHQMMIDNASVVIAHDNNSDQSINPTAMINSRSLSQSGWDSHHGQKLDNLSLANGTIGAAHPHLENDRRVQSNEASAIGGLVYNAHPDHLEWPSNSNASCNISVATNSHNDSAICQSRTNTLLNGNPVFASSQFPIEPTPNYPGLEGYQLIKKMGEGAFSQVYLALANNKNEHVAIKVIDKQHLSTTQRTSIQKELIIHSRLSHPNIVELQRNFENHDYYFFELEIIPGGEIFHKIVELTYFSEDLARHVAVQVAHGLRYLHETVGVVHRDIKPENLLFNPIAFPLGGGQLQRVLSGRTPGEDKLDEGPFDPCIGGGGIGVVKIADFGLSKVVWRDGTKTPCGTVGYTAPEIVTSQSYTTSVDLWALGCVLYTTLCGFPPFYDEDTGILTHKVARGDWDFLSPWWDNIGQAAKDLVSCLLEFSPEKRYTISDFFNHPWVLQEDLIHLDDEMLSPCITTTANVSKNGMMNDMADATSAQFDWNAFVLPALKTPAIERAPDDRNVDESLQSFRQGDTSSKGSGTISVHTPSTATLKHYFDTSLRVYNELQERPSDDNSAQESDVDGARQLYDELGYMQAGMLTPAFEVARTAGLDGGQSSRGLLTSRMMDGNEPSNRNFQLKLADSSILHKRRSKKAVKSKVAFAGHD